MIKLNLFIVLSVGLIGIGNCLDCDCMPNIDNRIVNGEKAANHEFPWQLSLGLKRGNKVFHICGATILNKDFVVTASHCVVGYKNEGDYLIGFGSNDLESMTIDKRIAAEKIIIHPLYRAGKASSKGDIALIKLSKSLNLTNNVKPACLVKDQDMFDDILEDQPNQVFTASGWGSTTRTWKWIVGSSLRGGKIPRYLMKADFKHVQEDEKKNECKNREDLICIKPIIKRESVCNGDSGGPLTTTISSNNSSTPSFQNNKMAVVGVTSFGSGDISYPIPAYVTFCNGQAAYTKIPYFNDFLTSHINENDLCMI